MRMLNDVLTKVLYHDRDERILTGFKELDVILGGGIKPRSVTLIAGRPAMGKTSFLLDVAIHHSKTTGEKVAFFSFEESAEDIALRILSKEGLRWYSDIERLEQVRQDIQEGDREVYFAYNEVKDLPILLYWNPCITTYEIQEICEKIDRLGMIIIDSSERFDMDCVSAKQLFNLSQITKRLNVPVVCSCGVDRSVELQDNHRPFIESIVSNVSVRDSIPPTIIALYRDDYYYRDLDFDRVLHYRTAAEAIVIPYYRSESEEGIANLTWNERKLRFENQH